MTLRRLPHQLLCTALSLQILLQPFLANAADGIIADQAAAAAQRPAIDQASNGVPVVNITAPNGAGLSHNKFSEFNVGTIGAIINNASNDGVSQLGGAVLANPNLVGRSTATTILAEVTSANRSRLNGFTEIFGGRADFILANPNGITCDGCGFLNTPRATLSTGAPQWGADGGLAGLAVRQGDIMVTGNGLNTQGIDVLDILSRSVSLQGAVNAKAINVVAGSNDVAYADRAVTAQAADAATKPLFAIDSTALGGMYANRISLVATESGVGVNMIGDMAANAGELRITAHGGLALRNASASTDMALSAQNGTIAVTGTVAAQGKLDIATAALDAHAATLSAGTALDATVTGAANLQDATMGAGDALAIQTGSLDASRAKASAASIAVTAATGLTATGATIAAQGNLSLAATTGGISAAGATLAAGQGANTGDLSVKAEGGGALSATGATVQAAGNATLNGGAVSVDGSTVNSGVSSDGSLSLAGKLTISAGGTLSYGQNAKLAAATDVAVTAAATDGGAASGGIQAGRDVSVVATTMANTTGGISAGRDIRLDGSALTVSGGAVTAGRDLNVTATSLVNQDNMAATNNLDATATASLTNAAGAVISTGGAATLNAPTLSNAGRISAQGSAGTTAALLVNSGAISARTSLDLWIATLFSNQGMAFAGTSLAIDTAGSVSNDGGSIIGGTALTIGSGATGLAALVENISGTMQAGLGDSSTADATLSIRAGLLSNRKKTFAVSSYTQAAPQENTSGVNCGGANEGCTTSVSYDIQAVTADSEAPKILSDGAMNLQGGTIANDQGLIHSNGTMTIRGESLTNSAATLTTTKVAVTVMHWYEKHCGWFSCSDSRWTTSRTDRTLQSSGTVYGTIESADLLDAQLSGTIANLGVVEGVALYGLVAGTPEDSVRGTAFDAVGVATTDGPLVQVPTPGSAGLYVQSQNPLSKALVETNPALTSLASFYGSDYFIAKAGIDANAVARRLGDSAYETKLVRDAIFAETGRRYLAPDITSDTAQMQRLLDAAASAQTALNLSWGVSLSADQVATLTQDIVWFENVVVDGQTVLAPRLYLAQVHQDNLTPQSAGIIASAANLQAAKVVNSGLIATNGALSVTADADVVNQGGTLAAGTALQVAAGQDAVNLSGQMKGQSVAVTAGRDVINSTAVTTVSDGGSTDAIMHQQGAISASNGVTVTAGRDIASAGGKITAGTDASLTAAGNVLLASATATDSFDFKFRYGEASGQTTRNLGSTVSAGGAVAVTAGADIALAGSTVSAGTDATLKAGGNILVSSVQDSSSHQSKISSTSGGLFGSSSHSVEDSASRTTTIGSAVTAQGNVTLSAQGGDAVVQASKLAAQTGAVDIQAQGNVIIAAGTDSTQSSHKDEREGFLKSGLDKIEDAGSTVVGSEIKAGTDIKLTAQTGDVTVQPSTLDAGGKIAITATQGQVAFQSAADSAYHAETHNNSGLVWQTAKDEGRIDETTRYASLQAGQGLEITAAKGVVADIHSGDAPLAATLERLGQQPGTAWLAEIAQRDDVRWHQVAEAHESWDYHSQGLSGPGAAIVAIAVAIATQGAGSALLGAATGAGEGAFVGTIGGAMADAAFTSLVSQASISLINNQGNLGKVLAELGSTAALRNLATSVAAAGAFNVVGTATDGHFGGAGINNDGKTPTGYFGTGKYVTNVAGHAVVGGAVSLANGGTFVNGALSGGAGAALSPVFLAAGKALPGSGAVLSSALGGTTAALGGGDFKTGAMIAGLGYLYNEMGEFMRMDPATRSVYAQGNTALAGLNSFLKENLGVTFYVGGTAEMTAGMGASVTGGWYIDTKLSNGPFTSSTETTGLAAGPGFTAGFQFGLHNKTFIGDGYYNYTLTSPIIGGGLGSGLITSS